MILEPNIRYYPETDTMAIELRPYPGSASGDVAQVGGQDEAEDLVVHYAADGAPWLWEIEHASAHRRGAGANSPQRDGGVTARAGSESEWPVGASQRARVDTLSFFEILERAKGFEPSTPTLARSCSTPELHPHPRGRRGCTDDRQSYAKCGRRMQQGRSAFLQQ